MNPRAARPTLPLIIVLLAGACLLTLATVPDCRAAVRTARLMPTFFPGLTSDRVARQTRPIVSEREPLAGSADAATLHIWRPASGRYPALVVSLGVNPAPPDDPRVVRLFSGLARAGIVAVLVESPDLNEDRITRAAPDLIVRAFERTAELPAVRDGRVGLAGFSVGAALVQLAAADPRISGRVALVEAFGGFADMETVIAATTTARAWHGPVVAGGPSQEEVWEPDPLAVSVVRKNVIAGVRSESDRTWLNRSLVDGEDLPPPALLSEHGRAVLALLVNSDPPRVAALLDALPVEQRAELRALSPVYRAAGITAPVFIMHDRADPLLPYTESRRMRDALHHAGRPPYFSEFAIFEHVEPGRITAPSVLARDGARLFTHIYWVLRRLNAR